MELKELIEVKKLTATAKPGAPENPEFKNCNAWTITLKYQGRRASFSFYRGSYYNNTAPTAAEVLECIMSDTIGYDCAGSFERWADEYGYDTDSRRAERIYKKCGQNAKKLRRLLGSDFDTFANGDDEEQEARPRRYTLAELQALPTLCKGHTDNLKIESETVRVWLARVGVADGMPYDNGVTVENLIDGKWITVEEYEAK